MKYFILSILLIPFVLFAQKNLNLTKKGINIKSHIPKGLMVGDIAPIINLTSTEGNLTQSATLLKEKQIVIIFYRGKWCPVCSRYLSNLNDSLKYIVENNASVLVIGPEKFKNAEKTAALTKAKFILLPDTTFQVLNDFDVMFEVRKGYVNKIKIFKMTDIAKNNKQDVAKLPVPATFIIGRDGKIKWRHFDYNYSIRASVREIIDNLK